MKKLFVYFLLFILSFSMLLAQTWDSLGGGVGSKSYGTTLALCIYNNNLIGGGEFYTVGNTYSAYCIAQWDGATWRNYPGGEPSGIFSLLVSNGNLIAGTGEYGFLAGLPGPIYDIIGQWNGLSWNTIGPGIINNHGIGLYSLAEYNGNLYAGGYYYDVYNNLSYDNILESNGAFWDTLPQEFYIEPIHAMTVFNGNLYVGGGLYPNGNNMAIWNGTNWSVAGTGLNGKVFALAVYNGALYVAGSFDSAGGVSVNNVAAWNDSSWSALGNGLNDTVYSLAVYGSVLVAGGTFTSAGGAPCNKIAYWDGSTWSPLGSGIVGESVNALCSDTGTLYIGGQFDSAGGIRANNIAQWRSPVGVKNIKTSKGKIIIFPNPNNGIFTLSLSNITEKCNVEIYNVMGLGVYFATLNQVYGNNLIDLSNKPNGIYFYRVLSENGILVGEGKIVIEK